MLQLLSHVMPRQVPYRNSSNHTKAFIIQDCNFNKKRKYTVDVEGQLRYHQRWAVECTAFVKFSHVVQMRLDLLWTFAALNLVQWLYPSRLNKTGAAHPGFDAERERSPSLFWKNNDIRLPRSCNRHHTTIYTLNTIWANAEIAFLTSLTTQRWLQMSSRV